MRQWFQKFEHYRQTDRHANRCDRNITHSRTRGWLKRKESKNVTFASER